MNQNKHSAETGISNLSAQDMSTTPSEEGESSDEDGPQTAEAGTEIANGASDQAIERAARSSKPKPQQNLFQRLKRAFFGPGDGVSLREDFTEALKDGDRLQDAFSADERAMLDNILLMREVRVENVMVPRADIEAVDSSISLGELLTVFEHSGHSRMPVFQENLDDPKGMVHIKDLLAYLTRQARNGRRAPQKSNGNGHNNGNSNKPAKPLDLTRIKLDKTLKESGIIRSVLFVPESMLASDLLKRMQATRTQMALVIDEYGGTDGLVSLEDVVEIVVGDIEDEHDDVDAPHLTEISDGIWQTDAKTDLEDLATVLKIDLKTNENAEDVDTIGGLIFAELGRVPVRGEVIRMFEGFEVHIIDADARRIKRVRIIKLKTSARRRSPRAANDLGGNVDAQSRVPNHSDTHSSAAE